MNEKTRKELLKLGQDPNTYVFGKKRSLRSQQNSTTTMSDEEDQHNLVFRDTSNEVEDQCYGQATQTSTSNQPQGAFMRSFMVSLCSSFRFPGSTTNNSTEERQQTSTGGTSEATGSQVDGNPPVAGTFTKTDMQELAMCIGNIIQPLCEKIENLKARLEANPNHSTKSQQTSFQNLSQA